RMKPGEYGLFHLGELIQNNASDLKDVPFAALKPSNQAPTEPLE
ncbi:class II glutamine amidotransferase, partial [Vibrio parahaemolyticus]|nr:class II glutamine amidotransferase [Vibrio parahaemolyticus]